MLPEGVTTLLDSSGAKLHNVPVGQGAAVHRPGPKAAMGPGTRQL